jgi:hypothetical protein
MMVSICLVLLAKQKNRAYQRHHPSAARPSWSYKTRSFPSSSCEEFGFIVELFIFQAAVNETFISILNALQNVVHSGENLA